MSKWQIDGDVLTIGSCRLVLRLIAEDENHPPLHIAPYYYGPNDDELLCVDVYDSDEDWHYVTAEALELLQPDVAKFLVSEEVLRIAREHYSEVA